MKAPESVAELLFSPVKFSEIDINQHFTSGRYIERIIDSYDFEFHKNNTLIEFEVNFLKEGFPEDKLAVKKQVIDDSTHLCSIVRQSDGADMILMRLVWQKR